MAEKIQGSPAAIIKKLIDDGVLKKFADGGGLTTEEASSQFAGNIAGIFTNLISGNFAGAAMSGLGAIKAGGAKIDRSASTNSTNPYAMGGQHEPGGFKQYNAPGHEQGGQNIGEDGMPMENGDASIEGTENKYTYSQLPDKSGKTYIFSDRTGTSDMIKNIMKKYKNKNTEQDFTEKAAMEAEIKEVEKLNDVVKQIKDNLQQQFSWGGKKEYAWGGGDPIVPDDVQANINTTMGELTTPTTATTYNDMRGGYDYLDPPTLPTTKLGEYPTSTGLDIQTDRSVPVTDPGDMQLLSRDKKPEDYAINIDPYTAPKLSEFRQEDGNGLTTGQILRGASYLGSAIDAFKPYDRDKEILPDYTRADDYMQKANADLTAAKQAAQSNFNVASNMTRNSASSYAQFRSRQLANIANLQDNMANISQQEQGMRNNLNLTKGSYEADKANRIQAIKDNVQIRNLQNKARSQDLQKQFYSDIMHEADRLDTIKNNKELASATREEGYKILGEMFPDYQLNTETMDLLVDLSKGKITEEEFRMKAGTAINYKTN